MKLSKIFTIFWRNYRKFFDFLYKIINFSIKNSRIWMKISPAVPLGTAGAKNLEFLPKNQFFHYKKFHFFRCRGGGINCQTKIKRITWARSNFRSNSACFARIHFLLGTWVNDSESQKYKWSNEQKLDWNSYHKFPLIKIFRPRIESLYVRRLWNASFRFVLTREKFFCWFLRSLITNPALLIQFFLVKYIKTGILTEIIVIGKYINIEADAKI